MYYIGLDIHKKTISYCVKDASGQIHREGKIGSTRCDQDTASTPHDRDGSDDLHRVDLRSSASACGKGQGGKSSDGPTPVPYLGGSLIALRQEIAAQAVGDLAGVMLRAITAAKRKNDRIGQSPSADQKYGSSSGLSRQPGTTGRVAKIPPWPDLLNSA